MTTRIDVRRSASVPDPVRVTRCHRAPELGPRILFLSGGSALAKVARQLKLYTHNSIHIVTPFDSGGSSAEIRRAFRMLSVGDLRNRLLALADETIRGNPEIFALFSHRLPANAERHALHAELESMIAGEHVLIQRIHEPLRQIIRSHLREFCDRMPDDFELAQSSIGNLVLCGGYLGNGRDIAAVIFLFSQLVEVRGRVEPAVDADLHLAAELESGERVVGQHRLTGKNAAAIDSRVERLFLVDGYDDPTEVSVDASDEVRQLIRSAELICFPMGSFYSSVIANLLPRGIGRAISEAPCPKIFVPNMAHDPEQFGMTLSSAVQALVDAIRRDAGEDTPVDRILNLIALDTERGRYELPLDVANIKEMGIETMDVALVRGDGWPLVDAQTLAEVLISLV